MNTVYARRRSTHRPATASAVGVGCAVAVIVALDLIAMAWPRDLTVPGALSVVAVATAATVLLRSHGSTATRAGTAVLALALLAGAISAGVDPELGRAGDPWLSGPPNPVEALARLARSAEAYVLLGAWVAMSWRRRSQDSVESAQA